MTALIDYKRDVQVAITDAQLARWTVDEPNAGGPLLATGPCPTCGDEFSYEIRLEIVSDALVELRNLGPAEDRTTRRIVCLCTTAHPDRPPAITGGCGRWWLVTLIRDGEGWHMQPGGDETVLSALKALDAAVETEISATRAAAEKWLQGITALYGLFGLAGLALGKDSVKGLSDSAKISVAVAVVFGLVATIAAVVLGYKAAFGWPVEVDVSDDAKLRAWFERRRESAVRSAENLKKAVTAAILALSLLLLAVGVIWFGPSATPVSPLVKVDYADPAKAATAGALCGKLADPSDESKVAVRVTRSSEESTEVIDGAWVKSIKPVSSCS